MKITIGENDICNTCKYKHPLISITAGCQLTEKDCPAEYSDVFLDDTRNISDCRCYTAKKTRAKSKIFVKPTVEEIAEYVDEKGYEYTNPQAFYDYYESVNWYRGKTKITCWKKAVSGWNERQKGWHTEKIAKEKKDKLQSKPSYDMEEIKKRAMENTEI
ncbi:MAG: hypothetical protein K2L19_01775 [Eubacterium sp.]|nr:hypothetical protein [Eubacterium sp.]